MKTTLILHGITGNSQENWFPWLKSELEKVKHTVICPDLPDTHHPDRQVWLDTVKKLIQDTDHTELTIVGHSLGVPTALDYIESSAQKVHQLISVSGFYQAYGMELNDYFMKAKDINMSQVVQNLETSKVLFGDDDPYVPQPTLHKLAKSLHVTPIIIPHGGHLNAKAGFTQFPLLLEIFTQQT